MLPESSRTKTWQFGSAVGLRKRHWEVLWVWGRYISYISNKHTYITTSYYIYIFDFMYWMQNCIPEIQHGYSKYLEQIWKWLLGASQDILQFWLYVLAPFDGFFGQFGASKSGRTSGELRYLKDASPDFLSVSLPWQIHVEAKIWGKLNASWPLGWKKRFGAGIPAMFLDVFSIS